MTIITSHRLEPIQKRETKTLITYENTCNGHFIKSKIMIGIGHQNKGLFFYTSQS